MDAIKFVLAVVALVVLPAVLIVGAINQAINGEVAQVETTGQLTGAISDQAGAIETLSNTVSEMARELVNMANRLIDAKQEQVNGLQDENRALRFLLYGAGVVILALVILPKLKRKDKTA